MNIPRQFYGMNYISRLFSNFQDSEMVDCPKLCFSEIHDITETTLPTKETFELGVSAAELSNMLHTLVENRSCCLDGLGIAKNEALICAGYRPPYTKENPHITNSTCKTITAIAVMFALSEGLLGVEDTVLSFFPEYETLLTSKYVKQMTVEHLLTMTSGSKCTEVTAVVEDDWVKAFLLTECQCEPGTQFIYNSMNTYMLSAILCKVTEMSLLEYLRPRLLEPLGINHVTWELCPKGMERGGWGMHLSIEGMLKIGLFLAQDGVYGKRQLIEASYIQDMKKMKVSQDVDTLAVGYAYQLWNLPDGFYMLSGMYGQHVIIDDKNKLVIATNAHNDKMFPDSRFTRIILDCMKSEKLYMQEGKWKEKTHYKKFTQEFQAFCNGWELRKENKRIPYRLYCKTQEKSIIAERERLKEKSAIFDGNRLHIEQATFKLFPYMMRGMYQFPPFAVTDIVFKVSDNLIKMCFVKENTKKEKWDKKVKNSNLKLLEKAMNGITAEESVPDNLEPQRLTIKAGFARYCDQIITIGPNEIHLAAKIYLSIDEDGNDVMQLDMVFPATGFSRKIKFFLLEDKVSIECMEYPDMKAIVEQVMYGETVLAGNSIDLTGKVPEGLRVLMDHKVEPRVNGAWVT